LVFIAAGLLKALDPAEFAHQMATYEIVPPGLLTIAATALIAFEITLGAALLIGFRTRVSALTAAGLLVLFIALEGYNLAVGREESCGCFGSYVQRTPTQVILEDLLLLALAILVWSFLKSWKMRRAGLAAGAVIATAVASLGLTVASPHLPIDTFVTQLAEGRHIDDLGIRTRAPVLAEGRYLVALLDLADPAAVDAAAELNAIAAWPDAPGVIALTPSDEEERAAFLWSAIPDFEIYPVDRSDLKKLYRRLPRFFLVESGRVVTVYDGPGLPSPDLLSSRRP
jgi:uncharacterized membrane protein YphA (DoxX/SURF4 family)